MFSASKILVMNFILLIIRLQSWSYLSGNMNKLKMTLIKIEKHGNLKNQLNNCKNLSMREKALRDHELKILQLEAQVLNLEKEIRELKKLK